MTVTVIGGNTGDDFTGVSDCSISENFPTTNYNGVTVEITNWDAGEDKHGLIRFDGLSNISASEVVSTVTMGIYRKSGDSNTHTIEARRLLVTFVDSQATWNIRSTGNNWTTAGALSDGNDRSGTQSGTFTSASGAGYKTFTDSSGLFRDDIQDFIDGTYTNDGHFFKVTDASNYWAFYSSTIDTDGQRPYISVTHTTALAITKNNSMLAARNTRRMMRSYRSRGR